MYDYKLTENFRSDCQDVRDRGKTDYERVKKLVDTMRLNPFHNSTVLKGKSFNAKRRRRVGDLRVIYAVCHECKQTGHDVRQQCEWCSPELDKTIIFFNVGDRDDIYQQY